MKAFRKQNNLDMSSLVIVHDGDADNCSAYKTMDTRRNYITNVEGTQMLACVSGVCEI